MTENTYYCSFVGNQYIVCECGVSFPNEDALREHLENDPHNSTLRSFTEYKCGECSKIYATEQECIDHQEEEHVAYIKEEPTYMTDEPLYFKEVAEEPLFVKKESFYIEQVEEEEDQDEALLGMFEEVETKPRGRRQTVQVTEGEGKKKKKTYVNKNVVCEVCGKKYASNAALGYHQRVHTGVRPYQCTYCPKNFTMGLFLQIHTRTHTGERPYQCPRCPKAFSNRAALLRHDRVHTGVKPYQCPKCGKYFTQSNSMKLHVHTVHMKMPAPYKSKRRRADNQARQRAKRRPTTNIELICQDELISQDDVPVIKTEVITDLTELKTEAEPAHAQQPYPGLEGGDVLYCEVPAPPHDEVYEFILA